MSIRPYVAADFDPVTILWRIARECSLPDFQLRKGHFFYEDQDYFREHILLKDQIWVMEDAGVITAFMAINNDFIDYLYVHPGHWRKGLGRQFLDFARNLSPAHLWLFTLQVNLPARAFYEKNGFVPERFGVSSPPENEPDVEYHWRPSR